MLGSVADCLKASSARTHIWRRKCMTTSNTIRNQQIFGLSLSYLPACLSDDSLGKRLGSPTIPINYLSLLLHQEPRLQKPSLDVPQRAGRSLHMRAQQRKMRREDVRPPIQKHQLLERYPPKSQQNLIATIAITERSLKIRRNKRQQTRCLILHHHPGHASMPQAQNKRSLEDPGAYYDSYLEKAEP